MLEVRCLDAIGKGRYKEKEMCEGIWDRKGKTDHLSIILTICTGSKLLDGYSHQVNA